MSTTTAAPTVNKGNLKRQPIPVVPSNLRIVNDDGTPTRSGKLLLEQLQLIPNLVAGNNITLTDDGAGNITIAASGAASSVIGFVINSGTTGTNVGPMLAAPHAGSVTQCVVVTKASDSSTALTFTIKQNGTSVFTTAPTVAAGTAAGTVSTFTTLTSSPLPVAAGDVFSIDITSGTGSWQFTSQLET